MYYAVCWRKYRCVDMLDLLGVSVNSECDMLHQAPMTHARRTDDYEMIKLIDTIHDRSLRVANLFYNNYLRFKTMRWYRLVQQSVRTIQRLMRGKLGRKKAKKKRIKKKKLGSKKKTAKVVVTATADDEAAAGDGPAAQGEDDQPAAAADGSEAKDGEQSAGAT